ncbi:sigma-E processing peptidase SpoIIGA [Ectobacillus antri]|uniref:sigma-E processing peptidase SpoIIGA n=1 Tax=Ectobacillus antri TaxID=2486280 RepID=UPI000F59A8D7|nr:sigma-E processing peptidase SpoIIGA [Ectobacillus antri]
MIIYADIIWVLNVCIDFLLLFLTSIILKRKVKKRRLLCGALLASTIVIFAFTPFATMMTHPFTKLLYSICIIYVTFGFTRIRTFFQTLLMFYFATFMVGGGLLGMHFFVQTSALRDITSIQTSSFGDPVSWLFVVVGFPIMYYFSKARLEEMEMTKIRYDQIIQVEIEIGNERVVCSGLIDSGNQLYDPLTKTPVMIVEVQKMGDLFPDWLKEQAKHATLFTETRHYDESWLNRIRIIPYRAIGQNHQFLLAVKPDCVRLYAEQREIAVHHVLIGLSHTTLSSDEEYTCIVHPKMLLSTTA